MPSKKNDNIRFICFEMVYEREGEGESDSHITGPPVRVRY